MISKKLTNNKKNDILFKLINHRQGSAKVISAHKEFTYLPFK